MCMEHGQGSCRGQGFPSGGGEGTVMRHLVTPVRLRTAFLRLVLLGLGDAVLGAAVLLLLPALPLRRVSPVKEGR